MLKDYKHRMKRLVNVLTCGLNLKTQHLLLACVTLLILFQLERTMEKAIALGSMVHS